jgi:DeoR family transcriptional regulator, fructose operon transcriptional repressor
VIVGQAPRKIIQKSIKDITIITNSNTILNELIPYKNISVISTGGILLNKFNCYVGPLAELVVSQIRANKFFFSVAGVTSSGEITDTDIQEVNAKKKMIEVANKKILMVGSHKFNKAALYKVSDIKDIDLVICDGRKEGRIFMEKIKNKRIDVEF